MPINLRQHFGKKYRIDYERYIDGSPVNRLDLWTMQLKSAIGHVYVHSETHLGFATRGNRSSLRKIPELQLVQDGDDGQNYSFKIELLPKLAKKLKLRTRRQVVLTEEQRAICGQRLKRARARRQLTLSTEQEIDALTASEGPDQCVLSDSNGGA